MYQLYINYPQYFDVLEEMEKDSFNSFKPNKTIKQIRQQFESGKIPKRKKKVEQISLFDTARNYVQNSTNNKK